MQLILLDNKNVFTGKKVHEFYFELPDKMLFFTGQFIHSFFFAQRTFQFLHLTSNILSLKGSLKRITDIPANLKVTSFKILHLQPTPTSKILPVDSLWVHGHQVM
jgi:hypothetical protein